jgi:LysR substrate binding domain
MAIKQPKPCKVSADLELMVDRVKQATRFLKALSHECRLLILCLLSEGEKSVTNLESRDRRPLQTVKLSDLHNEPFIVRTGNDMFQDGTNVLASHGIKIRVVSQTDQFDRSMALVDAGIGLALVPACFAMPAVKQVLVSDLGIVRIFGLLWLREREDHDLEVFIEFAESHGWTP